MTTELKNEWYGDIRKLLRFRIANLLIGDALICESTGWRVDCGEDVKRLGERQFIISCRGEELARRKRIESTVDFLVGRKAPATMEYVYQGASHLLETERLDDIELLGYLPSIDKHVDTKHYRQRRFSQAVIQFAERDSFFGAPKPSPFHNVMRFVVQEKQATWFDTQCQAV